MWINRLTKTITYGEHTVELTVRGESGMDSFIERSIFRRIYKAVKGVEYSKNADFWSPEVQAISTLVEMINRTESVAGLPEDWATAGGDDDALRTAYALLEQLPSAITAPWIELLEEASKPPGDPALFPPKDLSAEDKGNPDSQKKDKS